MCLKCENKLTNISESDQRDTLEEKTHASWLSCLKYIIEQYWWEATRSH